MEKSADPVVPVQASTQAKRSPLLKRLTCPNPFYLLSTACVIHSTGLSLTKGEAELPLWTLLTLVGGYLMLLAVIGCLIVRFWKVWDDARSIFVTLVLLMLELALAFDLSLANHDAFAMLGLLSVTLGCLLFTELILRLMKLKLPLMYRVPLHLQLTLLLCSSLLPASLTGTSESMIRWSIYLLSALSGLSMFTLIPAVRSGARAVETERCPWKWPLYPWSLFVVVWVCLGFRLFLLTISFDPALELPSNVARLQLVGIFGSYLLVPMLLGICWLIIEAALAHKHPALSISALVCPAICVWLSSLNSYQNQTLAHFIKEITSHLGSPLWLAIWSVGLLYATAWRRGLPHARRGLLLCLIAITRVDSETHNLQTLGPLNPFMLVVLLCLLVVIGVKEKSSWPIFEATIWGSLSLKATGVLADVGVPESIILVHLLAGSAILMTLIFHDEFAEFLRELCLLFFLVAPIGMLFCSVAGIYAGVIPVLYLLGLTFICWSLSQIHQSPGYLAMSKLIGFCAYASGFVEAGRYLHEQVHWKGLKEFLIGIALLHFGVLMSAIKGRSQKSDQQVPLSGPEVRVSES